MDSTRWRATRPLLFVTASALAVMGLWLGSARLHASEQVREGLRALPVGAALAVADEQVLRADQDAGKLCVRGLRRLGQMCAAQVRQERAAAVRRKTRTTFDALACGGRVLSFVRVGDRRIALTLDDGPSPATPRTLEILSRHGVRATFFLVGRNAAHYPAMVRRIREGGHEIENHTWSHELGRPYTPTQFTRSTLRHQLDEVSRTDRGLHEATRFLRAPGGLFGPCGVTIEAARALHKVLVNWDVSGDTPGRGRVHDGHITGLTPRQLLAAYESRVTKGSIILMHPENRRDAPYTLEILDRFLVDMQHKGYRFVTLDEMLLPESHPARK